MSDAVIHDMSGIQTEYNGVNFSSANQNCRSRCVVAGTDLSKITDIISDHYPVYASWIHRRVVKNNKCSCNHNRKPASGLEFNLY